MLHGFTGQCLSTRSLFEKKHLFACSNSELRHCSGESEGRLALVRSDAAILCGVGGAEAPGTIPAVVRLFFFTEAEHAQSNFAVSDKSDMFQMRPPDDSRGDHPGDVAVYGTCLCL